MLYLVIFLFLALCILLIFATRVNLHINYAREGWEDHFFVSLHAFSEILKLKYEIQLFEIGTEWIRLKRAREARQTARGADIHGKKPDIEEIWRKINDFREFYKRNSAMICRLREYLSCRLVLKKVGICAVIGMNDAMLSGILSGLAWSMAGIAISYLSDRFRTFERQVNIKTDYAGNRFCIELSCIFSIKTVHIIVVGLMIALDYIDRKTKFKETTIGGGIFG